METMYLVSVETFDGYYTLEEGYYKRISGGKCIGTQCLILVSEATYESLIEHANRDFDHDYYNSIDEGEEREEYFTEHAKDLRLLDGEWRIHDLETLDEILTEEFPDGLQIIRKQPKPRQITVWQ